MNADTESRIVALEQQIAALEEKTAKKDMALQLQIGTLLDMVKDHHQLHRIATEEAADNELRVQRLNDVYYHVFPDRLDADVKVDRQLRNILPKTSPEGDKKQS
jgi:hypothetical protein